jgi:uncharacterized protein
VAPGPAIETFAPVQLKDALVAVAFPTTGSASSIAAHYMIRHLELPLVGHINVPETTGVTAIQDGRAAGIVRIFGGEVACKLDHKCPRVYLVSTELALPPAVGLRVAEAILEWAKKGGAYMVLAWEGVVRREGDETPDVYVASAQDDVLAELRKQGLAVMERAIIAGVAAHLMLGAPMKGVRVGSLIVEASRDHPDGRAAVAILEGLAKILPDIAMDPKPLLKEALELEEEIRKAVQSAQGPQYSVPPAQYI